MWRTIEVIGAELFAFTAFIISARLFLPSEVGVVVQATLFVMTAQLILRQGLGEALIQSDETDSDHFSLAFWLNLAIGTAAALLLIAISDFAGWLLGEADLLPVLRALAPTLPLFAASGIYQAKLRRGRQFRGFAFASVAAALRGGLATISAYLQFAMRRLGLLTIGIFFTSAQAGFFSVANRLMLSAGMLTYYSIHQIGLPVLSRLARNRGAHLEAISKTLRLVSILCLPMLVGMVLVADILIPLALGETWHGSVLPFQILSAFGIFIALALVSGQILISAGHPGQIVRLSLANVTIFLGAITLAAPYGLVPAALAGGFANM